MSESDDEVGFSLPVFTSEDGEQVNIDTEKKTNQNLDSDPITTQNSTKKNKDLQEEKSELDIKETNTKPSTESITTTTLSNTTNTSNNINSSPNPIASQPDPISSPVSAEPPTKFSRKYLLSQLTEISKQSNILLRNTNNNSDSNISSYLELFYQTSGDQLISKFDHNPTALQQINYYFMNNSVGQQNSDAICKWLHDIYTADSNKEKRCAFVLQFVPFLVNNILQFPTIFHSSSPLNHSNNSILYVLFALSNNEQQRIQTELQTIASQQQLAATNAQQAAEQANKTMKGKKGMATSSSSNNLSLVAHSHNNNLNSPSLLASRSTFLSNLLHSMHVSMNLFSIQLSLYRYIQNIASFPEASRLQFCNLIPRLCVKSPSRFSYVPTEFFLILLKGTKVCLDSSQSAVKTAAIEAVYAIHSKALEELDPQLMLQTTALWQKIEHEQKKA